MEYIPFLCILYHFIYLYIHIKIYSVMQWDGNSFCGYVVSDSINKLSRYEDNILEQIHKKPKFSGF